ncbi:pSer/pThr/pTyr-binding forkhead associated (FHA) protein [Sphingomonas zeicaulis]|uniref:FHA domain-containing protein n=1 Tax=Sphingomonas zeicaulis TaxID=1632740 RepID=UPI003D225623
MPLEALTLTIENAEALPDGLPSRFVLEEGGKAVIGRSGASQWQLPDPDNHISSKHVRIAWEDGHFMLTDTSTNGTYVNGSGDRLEGAHRLADGDLIEIGHYRIAVALAGGEAVEEATVLPAQPRGPEIIGGRYRIERDLDEDGSFRLCHAVDVQLERPVLIRVAKPVASDQARTLLDAHFGYWLIFARQPIAGMPGVIAIEQAAEPPFIVTERAEGTPVFAFLAETPAEAARPLLDRLLRETLAMLASLHARGLVHGDVDMDNLLVAQDGAIWLTNPAPVPPEDEDSAYPAPELSPGQPLTAASDIYALGKLIEDAAGRTGVAAPAVIGWMTLPKVYRPSAADLLDTLGVAMGAALVAQPAAPAWHAPAPPPPPPPEPAEKPAPKSVSWEEFQARKQAAAEAGDASAGSGPSPRK